MSNVWTWPPNVAAPLTNAAVIAALYSRGRKPLWVPPSVAGGIDDEFDSVTINSSWVFRDITTGPTVRTPNFGHFNENVNLSGVNAVPNVALHTQGRSSYMLCQLTSTGPALYQIYRPFAYTAGHFYWCQYGRVWRSVGAVPTSGPISLSIWGDSGGFPDNNNRFWVEFDMNSAICRMTSVTGGVSSTVSFPNNEGVGGPSSFPYAGIANAAGVLGASATWYGEFFDDFGNRAMPVRIGGVANPFLPAYIGWQWQQDMPMSAGTPMVHAADFIREQVGHPLYNWA